MANSVSNSWHRSPHHNCDRCGREFLLDELQWQLGKLLCPDDVDEMVVGDREAIIAAAFEIPSKELEPDSKLVDATAGQISDTIHFTI